MKRISYIQILACILLCPYALFAQTTYTLVTSGGEWNKANTWLPVGIPGSTDFVIIIDKNVKINNTQHTIDGFNLTNGIIFFEGTEPMLTIADSAVWYDGEMDGGNGANGGNAVNSKFIISPGAKLIIDTDGTPQSHRFYEGITVINQGTIQHIGSTDLGVRGLSVVHNEGLYDMVSDADFTGETFSGGTFINTGTFRKSGGNDISSFNAWWTFQNPGGTIDAQSGSIHFTGLGSFDGANLIAADNAAIDFRSSTMNFKDTISGSPVGAVRLSGSTINIDSSGVIFDFQGTGFQFSKGTISGGGTLTIPEGSLLRLVADPEDTTPFLSFHGGTTLLNLGTVRQESNTTIGASGLSIIDNRSLFEIQTDADFSGGPGNGGRFLNTGTFRKSGGNDISSLNTWWNFQNNGGTIDAQSGSIEFNCLGTFDGVNFIAAANASIDFRSSTLIFKGTLSGSPVGAIRLSGSTIDIDSSGAMLDFQGTGFQFSKGTISGGGTLTIPEGSLLRFVADPIDATPFKSFTQGTTLLNLGTVRQESNTTIGASGLSIIDNRSLFDILTDADFSGGPGNGGRFLNSGTFRKSGGNDFSSFNTWWNFQNNGGTIDAQSGSIQFNCLGTFDGANFIAADSAAIDFRTSTLLFKGTLSGSPVGTVRLSGSTIDIDSNGATLDFRGTGFQFSKGTISGGGILTIEEGSLMRFVSDPVDPTPFKSLTQGTTLLNLGTIRQESTTTIGANGNAIVDNRSYFEILTDADFSGGTGSGGTFYNTGTFRKRDGNDVTGMNSWWKFFNQTGGVIDASSGTLDFTMGSSNFSNDQGAIIQGVASIGVPNTFTNNGIVSPGNSPAMLNYLGDFLPSVTSVLQVQLGGLIAGDQHDQLVVTGKAVLNGTLDVSLINGYIPSVGDSFIVLTTSGKISESFATQTATTGLYLDVKINANNVTLKVDSIGSVVSVNKHADSNGFKLKQNYPNPFSSKTVINYLLPEGRHRVSLKVFDISGNEVVTLINEEKTAGSYQAEFNAKDLSNGIYYYKLQTGVFAETKKMILMK